MRGALATFKVQVPGSIVFLSVCLPAVFGRLPAPSQWAEGGPVRPD